MSGNFHFPRPAFRTGDEGQTQEQHDHAIVTKNKTAKQKTKKKNPAVFPLPGFLLK